LEKPSLLATVFYIDLLSRSYPAFALSSLTVHRFLITAVTVASKGLCDAFCTNTHYAKVGGISVAELNMLELEFLKKVDWKIVPEPFVLEAYYKSMISQDPRYFQEAESSTSHLDPLKVGKTRTLSDSVNPRSSKIIRTDMSRAG
jgi:Cyclin